jgi:hypothetical protein
LTHPFIDLPGGRRITCFPAKFCMHFLPPNYSICPTHCSNQESNIAVILLLGDLHKWWSSSSYSPHFMHSSYVGQTDIFRNIFPFKYLRLMFYVTHWKNYCVRIFSVLKSRWDDSRLETEW